MVEFLIQLSFNQFIESGKIILIEKGETELEDIFYKALLVKVEDERYPYVFKVVAMEKVEVSKDTKS